MSGRPQMRFWTGLAVLAVTLFGGVGIAACLLLAGHPLWCAAVTTLVWLGSGQAAHGVARLVMLGSRDATY